MTLKASGTGTGIRDVAQLAGVSVSTVSKVLNAKTGAVRISAGTVERVRHAAAALHYRPNAAARSLRTTQAQTIGVIARTLLHPFIAELLRVISAACRERGYHLLLGHAEHSSAEGWALGDILSPDRVDGVLLIGDLLNSEQRRAEMERLIQTHGHVVTIGGYPSVAGELSILVDNEQGVSLALAHLVEMGHRSIGYLNQGVGPESWEDQQRRRAYRAFLRAHDLPYTPGAEQVVTDQIEAIQEALRELLALRVPPTAVFVGNDVTALVTMKAAISGGIRVPDDLSIIGFDDIPFSSLCTPGLTTVRQPIEAMGQHAADALLDRIGGQGTGTALPPDSAQGTHTLVFPPTLVCRETVCRRHGLGKSLSQGDHVRQSL